MFRFWFRVAFLMVLAAACSLAYVSSAQFKNEYATVDYSFGSVGSSGFSFAWVDPDKNPSLECFDFDYCSFIDIERAAPCLTSIQIKIAFLDAADKQLFTQTIQIAGRKVVSAKNVEIGTNSKIDFEWFVIDDIYCRGELSSGETSL